MSDDEAQSTIFLSYAHADKAKAQRIASALEKSGYVVWWDALIEGGSRFAKSIDEALDKADAVVVLWSKDSIESDWVKDEARTPATVSGWSRSRSMEAIRRLVSANIK